MRPRPRLRHATSVMAVAVALVVATSAGCGADVKKSASDLTNSLTQTAIRNAVAAAGVQAFHAKGHDLRNGLACSAHKLPDHYAVSCTGTTTDGEPAKLVGTVDSGDRKLLHGSFTGTVNGKPVFHSGCLGTRC